MVKKIPGRTINAIPSTVNVPYVPEKISEKLIALVSHY